MFKSIFLPILAVICFIILVGLLTQGKLNKFIKPTPISNSSNKTLKIADRQINIEIVKTDKERAKGLSNRDSLDQNSGMLFVFDKKTKPVFWMKDTKIPLDIIWINDNKIIGFNKNVQPEINVNDNQLTRYPAPSFVDFVLEVNAGFSDQNNLKIGQNLSDLEQF